MLVLMVILGMNHAMNNVVAADNSGNMRNFLALRSDNTLWAWGENDIGQVGDGTTNRRNEPFLMLENVASASIGAGSHFGGMALKTDGSLWAWGQFRRSHDAAAEVIFDSPMPVMIMQDFRSEHGSRITTAFTADDGTEWNRFIPMRQMTITSATIETADSDGIFSYGDEESQDTLLSEDAPVEIDNLSEDATY